MTNFLEFRLSSSFGALKILVFNILNNIPKLSIQRQCRFSFFGFVEEVIHLETIFKPHLHFSAVGNDPLSKPLQTIASYNGGRKKRAHITKRDI